MHRKAATFDRLREVLDETGARLDDAVRTEGCGTVLGCGSIELPGKFGDVSITNIIDSEPSTVQMASKSSKPS